MSDTRFMYLAVIMVDTDSGNEQGLTDLLTDDPLTEYIADAIGVAMEIHEIEGTVYHVHVSSGPHSEELEELA